MKKNLLPSKDKLVRGAALTAAIITLAIKTAFGGIDASAAENHDALTVATEAEEGGCIPGVVDTDDGGADAGNPGQNKEPCESIPESVPESIPESVPESIPESVPESIPESVPESIPESVPVSTPDSVPIGRPSHPPDFQQTGGEIKMDESGNLMGAIALAGGILVTIGGAAGVVADKVKVNKVKNAKAKK